MREHVLRVEPQRRDLVDIVGTGGDGANTFNISTAAALVAAAAGAGDREARQPRGVVRDAARPTCSRRSASGSTSSPDRIERSIDELGFGFLFAQAHHPAMGTPRPSAASSRRAPCSTCSAR